MSRCAGVGRLRDVNICLESDMECSLFDPHVVATKNLISSRIGRTFEKKFSHSTYDISFHGKEGLTILPSPV